MSAVDWAALVLSVTTIAAAFAGGVRWLVKHYLYELKPNGGGSVKDQVNRLESRVDDIYRILCERTEQLRISRLGQIPLPRVRKLAKARV